MNDETVRVKIGDGTEKEPNGKYKITNATTIDLAIIRKVCKTCIHSIDPLCSHLNEYLESGHCSHLELRLQYE